MITFPNCKINIGLKVCEKRSDGYHDLKTFFYPLPLTEALEAVTTNGASGQVDFSISGSTEDLPAENICIRAYKLLNEKIGLPGINMHLHKLIPTGAGLGGGSSDGAFALMLLNNLFELELSDKELSDFALSLGSDCPFFILNRPAFAKGRGEQLKPVSIDLSNYKFILVNPGIRISTAEAFSWIVPKESGNFSEETINLPVAEWKNHLFNDFEKPVFERYKVLGDIKNRLYSTGASFAGMSGTGSTLFGIYRRDITAPLDWPSSYFVRELFP